MRSRVKIKRSMITPQAASAAMAQDWESAIYASVGNKTIDYLGEGDTLDSVVDHAMDKHGMADEFQRLSSTRLEIHFGIDVSGSMYGGRSGGSPIKVAMYAARLLNRAATLVAQDLPDNVFKHTFWAWSSEAFCLTHPEFGASKINHRVDVEAIDETFSDISKSSGYWSRGTRLHTFCRGVADWTAVHGDPTARKLFIVVTDDQIGTNDKDTSADILASVGGMQEGMLLGVGGSQNNSGVNTYFTAYDVDVRNIRQVVHNQMLDFFQKLY